MLIDDREGISRIMLDFCWQTHEYKIVVATERGEEEYNEDEDEF